MVNLTIPNKYHLFFQNPDRIEALIQQLEKDLPELKNALPPNINSIYEALVRFFDKAENEVLLPQQLYKIDVSEEKLHEKMSTGTYLSFSDLLAESVLLREMEKVFYRITYS